MVEGCLISFLNTVFQGIQGPNHPHPGWQFLGDTRFAYLPNSPEGKEVLTLLKKAFDAKLIFTVGKSATSHRDNLLIWSDIEQKTCPQR